MSIKPRTIDNLGVESSVRYAKDKEFLDARLIEESRFIPQKTEVTVVKPYLPTEFDEYLSPQKTIWAAFKPPSNYFSFGKPVFSYQLMPSLGTTEKIEASIDKLEALGDALDKEERDSKEEKERQILLALLKCISKFDRTLSLINARRNQYQRG